MKENSRWQGYLLDKTKVDRLRESGTKLNTMEHDEIAKLKTLGPITFEMEGYHYTVKKRLYEILKSQSWFPLDIRFTHIYPYLYLKNTVDGRCRDQPDLDLVMQAARKVKKLEED